MPLTAEMQAYISATQTAATTAPDLGTLSQATHLFTPPVQRVMSLTDGTGAGQANVIYSDTNTLAASANTDLDLAGALTNAIGGTSVFARVKGLYIYANAANTNNVVLGGAASNAWAALLGTTGTLQIRPGTFLEFGTGSADATGYVVTAGTGDLLRFANSDAGTTVTYDVVIIGCSA